ncbi:mechanosensitive ion channel [Candidatus Aerophobetes bacterium]|nr:mechanosensitive ion channel [Candidatus Aerophobetes bacterium]
MFGIENWAVKLIWSTVIIVAGYAAGRITFAIVDRLFPAKKMEERPYGTPQETKTLATLIKSVLKYAIAFFVLGFLFRLFNVNLTPLLVSAGVVGFAIGFGAQNFIRDVLSGITLLFERNIHVGDYVEIAGSTGYIEEIGLRTTKIRDMSGQLHILFNGSITTVKNFTRGKVTVFVDVFLQKQEDTPRGQSLLRDVLEDYFRYHQLDEGEIQVSVLETKSPQVVVRAMFTMTPAFQSFVTQQMAPRLKEVFSEQNISLSSNRVDVTFRM